MQGQANKPNKLHLHKGMFFCYVCYDRTVIIEKRKQTDAKRIAIIDGDVAKIPMWTVKHGFIYAIVDADMAWLDGYLWHLSQGYVKANINGKSMALHHVVIGKPQPGLVTDHINRNKLDNRLANLRHITQAENVRNSSVRRDSVSGHKGVTQDRYYKDWIASICVSGKTIRIGRYKKLDDAIMARKNAEKMYL